jgi:hypothetical protein
MIMNDNCEQVKGRIAGFNFDYFDWLQRNGKITSRTGKSQKNKDSLIIDFSAANKANKLEKW